MEKDPSVITLPLVLSVCAATIGSSWVYGYNCAVLNSASPVIKIWIQNESYPHIHHNTPQESALDIVWNWIVSSYILAAVVGALLCGYAADKLGRKRATMLNALLVIVAGVVMGISKLVNIYILLLIGRVIVGVSSGLGTGLAPMYLTEIAPLRFRGLLGTVNQIGINVGIIMGQVFSLPYVLGTERGWPVLLAINLIPSLFSLIALLFCPESPKYLLVVNKNEKKAAQVLIHLRKCNDVMDEMDSIREEMTVNKDKDMLSTDNTDNTDNAFFWWSMSICLIPHIGMQFCGTSSVSPSKVRQVKGRTLGRA